MNATYGGSCKSVDVDVDGSVGVSVEASAKRRPTKSRSWRTVSPVLLSMLLSAAPLHAEPDKTPVTELQRLFAQHDGLIDFLQLKIIRFDDDAGTIAAKTNSITSLVNTSINTSTGTLATTSTTTTTPTAFEDTPAVDAPASERALERTLTQSGALLLPAGQVELQLSTGLIFSQQLTPLLDTHGGQATIKQYDLRRTEVSTHLSARIGLPLDAQLEFTLPYRKVTQSTVTTSDQAAPNESRASASMVGDFSAGLAKTLLREQDGAVDMVGRLTANFGTGSTSKNSIPIGEGFKKIRTELTLLKRVDPLVYTGSVSFESTFKKNAIKPGHQFGVSLSALLATSPDTSLSIGIDQLFSQRTRVQNVSVAGSDQISSVLVFGATSIVGKRTLLSLTVGKGLTRGTPDYFVNVAVPIRFDLLK